MLGLFKKTITPTDAGNVILNWANDFLLSDSTRSLATQFEDCFDFDASHGWSPFLEQKRLPVSIQILYCRFYFHCAIQAALTSFDSDPRRDDQKL
jgi:hypothetical protein